VLAAENKKQQDKLVMDTLEKVKRIQGIYQALSSAVADRKGGGGEDWGA
jgi:hypothetical protein